MRMAAVNGIITHGSIPLGTIWHWGTHTVFLSRGLGLVLYFLQDLNSMPRSEVQCAEVSVLVTR